MYLLHKTNPQNWGSPCGITDKGESILLFFKFIIYKIDIFDNEPYGIFYFNGLTALQIRVTIYEFYRDPTFQNGGTHNIEIYQKKMAKCGILDTVSVESVHRIMD